MRLLGLDYLRILQNLGKTTLPNFNKLFYFYMEKIKIEFFTIGNAI